MRNLSVPAVLKRLVRNPEASTRERIRALDTLAQMKNCKGQPLISRNFLQTLIRNKTAPGKLIPRASFLLIEMFPDSELLRKPSDISLVLELNPPFRSTFVLTSLG
jgi:hypothetical protein